MKFLKYLFILVEIFNAADQLSSAGGSTRQVVRGIRYKGGEYELTFTLKRVA